MRDLSFLGYALCLTTVGATLLDSFLVPKASPAVVSFDTLRARTSLPSRLRPRQPTNNAITVEVENGLEAAVR